MRKKTSTFVILILFAGFNTGILKAQDTDKAYNYLADGQFEKAALEYEKSIPFIKEKELNSKKHAKILLYTGLSFLRNNNYQKAVYYTKESYVIYKKNNTTQSEEFAACCNNIALAYQKLGYLEKSIPFYLESRKTYEVLYGKLNSQYALSVHNIGTLYTDIGDYQKAKTFLNEALEIKTNIPDYKKRSYANTCMSLATLYQYMGKYDKAEQLFIETKNIYENAWGTKSQPYAMSCNDLAGLYYALGNYQKASTLLIEAKNILEKTVGKTHPDYTLICLNLSDLYRANGNYSDAKSLLIKSKNITENNVGKGHPEYAAACGFLAALYESTGNSTDNFTEKMNNYEKAKQLYYEALNIREELLGKQHVTYATNCNNLAGLYTSIGNSSKTPEEQIHAYKKAEQFYEQAKTTYITSYGKKHSKYATICQNLANLYSNMGNFNKAEILFIEANNIINFLLKESAKFMTEKEREKYFKTKIGYSFEMFHSFFLTKRKEDRKLAGIIYNNSLNFKGQLLKSSIAVRSNILQSGDTSIINSYYKMNYLGKILAQQNTLPIAKRRSDIKQLEEQLNGFEKKLTQYASNSQTLKDKATIKWDGIQENLKKDEVAIEFIRFRYYNTKKWTDSTLYYALVLRKDYEYPKAIFLFNERQLQKLMKRNSGLNEYTYIKNIYDPKSEKADSLYKLIWQPIEKYLLGAKNIYVSPSGILNSISFDAVPYNKTNILSDKYKIIYTTSTSQVTNKTGLYIKDIKNIVLFGGIEYDIAPVEMEKLAINFKKQTTKISTTAIRSFPNNLTRSISWSYLPGSLEETQEIQNIFKRGNLNAKLYKDKQGSEEQFKTLEKNAPSILHVSTHGFYFGNDERSNEYKDMIDQDVKFVHSKNPLLRSGFILAGGNRAFQGDTVPQGVEDGVLTASEISNLNLFNTKLVVLSACQTGLGDVKGSEGVYGLQRSFKMAGVDYLLFSLWEVPDEQTKELMSNFYENWFSGLEIRDAFKKAQNQLKTKYKGVEGAAFAWAAFVLMK